MGSLYSVCFYEAHNVTEATVVIEAGFTAVVRDVVVFYSGGLGAAWSLLSEGDITWWYEAFQASTFGQSDQWQGRQVFKGPATFGFDASSGMDVRISGYSLLD